MIRTTLCFLFLCAITLFSQNAKATVSAGDTCTSYGATVMASDGQNLVACLKNQDDALIWKSMTSSSGSSPAGLVGYFPMASCPDGWIEANGQSTSGYTSLAAVVGTATPDLRGYFLRALDNGRGIDPSRTLASTQGDAIRNITGEVNYAKGVGMYNSKIGGTATGAFGPGTLHNRGFAGSNYPGIYGLALDVSRVVPTADENRPKNIALLACICTGE